MNNYETTNLLHIFLKWVLLGLYDGYEKRKRISKIDTLTSTITQLDVHFVKIRKQSNYKLIAKVPTYATLLKHH